MELKVFLVFLAMYGLLFLMGVLETWWEQRKWAKNKRG